MRTLVALLLWPAAVSAGLVLQARENVNLDDEPTAVPAVFSISDDESAQIRAWQLQIFDSDNEKVSYIQGRTEKPPRRINWYGLSPSGGLLPDGFYKALFVWMDRDNQVHKSAPASVSLLAPQDLRDILAPEVSLDYEDAGLIIRIKEGLVFAPGQWRIQPGSHPVLDKITAYLKAHPKNRLIVQGYADSLGGPQTNGRVSSKRALAVYRYFSREGVASTRLSYRGRGAANPIASNATAEGRAKNRRVEILVLKAQG